MEIKHAVFADLDAVTPGHAILASNTSSLSITEIGEATSRPGQGRAASTTSTPRRSCAWSRSSRATTPRPRPLQAAVDFAQAIRKMPITLRRGARASSSTASSTPRCREVWRYAGGAGALDQGDRRGRHRARRPRRWGRSGSPTCSAWTRSCTSPSTSTRAYGGRMYVHGGLRELVADGKLGAKTGGEGFYADGDGAASRRRRARPAGARRPLQPQGARRGVPARRGGRRLAPRTSTSG